ncbi:MAG: hypothetical protein L3J45_01800 [Flavobacteriaceae bacterium]|nr:hypothetical protein [Flavobacteriaceae bacterium]
MKKAIFILVFFASCQFIWAQQELNNYKYVMVPKHFDFQNSADSYKINSLVKFLLDKKGFITIFSDAIYPNDLITNQCLALKVNLLKNPSFMRTKIKMTFTNCQNKIIYESGEGVSKLKDYQRAYHEAIKSAYKSLDNYTYSYIPKDVLADVVVNKEPELNHLKKDAKTTSPKEVIAIKPVAKKVVEKPIVKKEYSIIGLYGKGKEIYEIAKFQKYYIFSKHISNGDSFQSKPLGFIYKTSRKGSYLVKTSNIFAGFLLNNGNFIIDKIGADGTIETLIYKNKDN